MFEGITARQTTTTCGDIVVGQTQSGEVAIEGCVPAQSSVPSGESVLVTLTVTNNANTGIITDVEFTADGKFIEEDNFFVPEGASQETVELSVGVGAALGDGTYTIEVTPINFSEA